MQKTPQQIERYMKGVANHWRISMLRLVASRPGITLDALCQTLNGEYKTLSVHAQRLAQAGLIQKKYVGHTVEHYLTPHGKLCNSFISSI